MDMDMSKTFMMNDIGIGTALFTTQAMKYDNNGENGVLNIAGKTLSICSETNLPILFYGS